MSRQAFHVVDELEQALAEYTGAPYAVAVDSCCNALLLSLTLWRLRHGQARVELPLNTYAGVPVAALNAGHQVGLVKSPLWQETIGNWRLYPTNVVDSARVLERDMYIYGFFTCLSFSMEKHLPVGRGGAIITDDVDAAEWFVRARHDGRTPGDNNAPIVYPSFHVNMAPDVAARALWLLTHLPDNPEPLPPTDYPDLAAILPSSLINPANSSGDSLSAPSLV